MRGFNSFKLDTSLPSLQEDDFYFLNKKLPPFGEKESVSLKKAALITNILKSPLREYMESFLDYFINDYDSILQCMNYLSIKPANDKSLLKSNPNASKNTYTSLKSIIEDFDDQLFQAENREIPYNASPYHLTSQNNHPSVKRTIEDLGVYESMIGTSQLNDITKMIDDELQGHYYKVNNYQGFYLDVTKVILNSPKLGAHLLGAPQIILAILDYIIIPHLFTSIESLVKKHNESDVYKLMELGKQVPSDIGRTTANDVLTTLKDSYTHRSSHTYEQIYGEDSSNRFIFHISTRLKNIPPTSDVLKYSVEDISDNDVGNIVVLTATVVLAGVLSIIEEEREYICKNCQNSFISKSTPESYLYTSQFKCPCYIEGTFPKLRCDGTDFIKGQYYRRSDYQEIRCQTIFNTDANINTLSVIPVVLRREIAGTCFPGDTVHISAFVKRRWFRLKYGERCETELFLDCINIERVNWKSISGIDNYLYFQATLYDNYWRFNRINEVLSRSTIIKSMCPELINLDNAKLALLLTLIGGFNEDSDSDHKENRWSKYSLDKKNKIKNYDSFKEMKKKGNNNIFASKNKYLGSRTQCHILFVGDPGTGKSHLLKYATKISYRHVSVIGKRILYINNKRAGTNCTSVGLTCTVVKDGPETMLAAGALVLASGGICCIDEFSTIKNDDKSCLHEAMEQQVISVAKAGLKCTLNCECTIVAATNCKMDKNKRGSKAEFELCEHEQIMNVDTPLPLLTRFDLIIVFRDNSTEDLSMGDYLLNDMHNASNKSICDITSLDWSSDNTIKNYIQFVRENIFPSMPNSCRLIIDRYYYMLRQKCYDNSYSGGPTVRTVESIVRLSQAHARLMFRNTVKVFDVVSVILMMEFGLQGMSIGCKTSSDQTIDRTGLFQDMRTMYYQYVKGRGDELYTDCVKEYKIPNGIVDQDMYDHFETLLLDRLKLRRSDDDSEEIVNSDY
ncbi:DNA replication protein [Theileria orientalis strain Shintoku]|uniref:DNA helicase n=1 Tax=Theileria orientalis strain Shintoku TaxID=869250 RepID=J4C4E2_THEOR|nr:DNA replication protein [Theileria orientalis strain Shintoku]BAM42031.1 DNA replication protein [Theileria orientalis strain Shintoku]|eukprot:XP_009692332.1 DNA replication protein [Theileria orientalis strain Shintoku]